MINRIYKWLKKQDKEGGVSLAMDIVWGLVGGLVWGLVGGLVGGLVWSLAMDIVWGLVGGLVAGLVWGIVGGLVGGLVWGLVGGLVVGLIYLEQLLPINFFWITAFIIITIVVTEILFLTNKKIKNPSWKKVIWMKLDSLFSSLLIIVNILNLYWVIKNIDWQKYFPEILRWMGFIGAGLIILTIIIGLFFIWLWTNKKVISR